MLEISKYVKFADDFYWQVGTVYSILLFNAIGYVKMGAKKQL